jgi:hypothetical protein
VAELIADKQAELTSVGQLHQYSWKQSKPRWPARADSA